MHIHTYIYTYVHGNCFILIDDSHLIAHHHPHHSCWVIPTTYTRMIQNHWEICTSMDLSGTSLYSTNTTHRIPANITQWQEKARSLVNAGFAGFRSEFPSPTPVTQGTIIPRGLKAPQIPVREFLRTSACFGLTSDIPHQVGCTVRQRWLVIRVSFFKMVCLTGLASTIYPEYIHTYMLSLTT